LSMVAKIMRQKAIDAVGTGERPREKKKRKNRKYEGVRGKISTHSHRQGETWKDQKEKAGWDYARRRVRAKEPRGKRCKRFKNKGKDTSPQKGEGEKECSGWWGR